MGAGLITPKYNPMVIHGNFLGAAIVAILYTVYLLWHPLPKTQEVLALVILNALTIILLAFAFK